MVDKPATAEEAIRMTEELRAEDEKMAALIRGAVTRKVGCRRSITVQIGNNFEKGEFWIEEEMPITGDRANQIRELEAPILAKVAAIQEYASKTGQSTSPQPQTPRAEKPDLIHFPGVQAPPKPDLEWITSEKNPSVEFIPAGRPGTQSFLELAKQKKDGYWLFDTPRGQLIFRKKAVGVK